MSEPVGDQRRLAEPARCRHEREPVVRVKRRVELLDQPRTRDQLRAPGRREQLGSEHPRRHSAIISTSLVASPGLEDQPAAWFGQAPGTMVWASGTRTSTTATAMSQAHQPTKPAKSVRLAVSTSGVPQTVPVPATTSGPV